MCPRFPFPLEKGDKLRMYHQLRYLSSDHEITLVTLTDHEISIEDRTHIEQFVMDLHIFKVTPWSKAVQIAKNTILNRPYQVAYYFSPKIAKQIQRIGEELQPDHIYCQLTRMSEYAVNLPFPKTLDYMDAFGIGMERRAEVVSGLRSIFYRKEAQRMKAYERKVYRSFDHHTVISKQDGHHICDKPIHVVPNGIDTKFYKPLAKEKLYDVGFVGNMGYHPNVDAAEYLINEVMSKLDPALQFVIAGARPDKRVLKLASDNVIVTGWMDDVRDAYAASRVFVAPLWKGTGQQNKIMEAMAMGIPCITTSVVNNAIGAEPNEEIMVADTAEEFAQSIQQVLGDQALSARLASNGRTFVSSRYSWAASTSQLSKIFRS